MKRILLMLFIIIAVTSNNANAQFNYYVSVEGGGGIGGGIGSLRTLDVPIYSNNGKAGGVSSGGIGVAGATGTISYGEKLEWGFTTGLKSYFGAVTAEDTYYRKVGFNQFYTLNKYVLTTSTVLIVPLIASVTYNFKEQGEITPFFSINGGYGLQVNSSDVVSSNNYTFGCEVGIKHKNIKGSIFYNDQGYTYSEASYVSSDSNYEVESTSSLSFAHINTVGVKITYCFSGRKEK